MWFGQLPTREAVGCYLAHSVRAGERRIGKGRLLQADVVEQLLQAGHQSVTVARLSTDDIHEDDAATRLAAALSGPGLRTSKAATGRVNLHATGDGLLLFKREAILAINAIDEEITLATLAENSWVSAGRMVATIKIIPYAVAATSVAATVAAASDHALEVKPPISREVLLIQTQLPSVKSTVLDKTRRVTEQRLLARGAQLVAEQRCDHALAPLVAHLRDFAASSKQWCLIVGASAISDRRDVIPAALEEAGGQVLRYGLPVDPGNLLMWGQIVGKTVLGLPGCARSPKYNGLDQMLDRLACEVPIDAEWITSLSVGGLLAETLDRPQPRVTATADVSRELVISGLVLAAGMSRRMGARNKLLVPYNGSAMICSVVETLAASAVEQIVVVTGHEHEQIKAALVNHPQAVFCYNPSYELGMGHSLARGISQLEKTDAVVVFLADMPTVPTAVINALINAAGARAAELITVPVYHGKRGNPVLLGKSFFDTLLQLEGDSGARFLIKQYPQKVLEVEVKDASVLQDFDTPKSLTKLP